MWIDVYVFADLFQELSEKTIDFHAKSHQLVDIPCLCGQAHLLKGATLVCPHGATAGLDRVLSDDARLVDTECLADRHRLCILHLFLFEKFKERPF